MNKWYLIKRRASSHSKKNPNYYVEYSNSDGAEYKIYFENSVELIDYIRAWSFGMMTIKAVNKINTAEDMSETFEFTPAPLLDLSEFDTTGVINTDNMFKGVVATIGYGKTQADCDKLNASLGKPADLIFVVKTQSSQALIDLGVQPSGTEQRDMEILNEMGAKI